MSSHSPSPKGPTTTETAATTATGAPVDHTPEKPKSSLRSSPEYVSVILTQLSLLVCTATPENVAAHYRQIQEILYSERKSSVVHNHYYRQFLSRVLTQKNPRPGKSPLDELFNLELQDLPLDIPRFEVFCVELKHAFLNIKSTNNLSSEEHDLQLLRFLRGFEVSPVLYFVFLTRIASPNSRAVKGLFERACASVLENFSFKTAEPSGEWSLILLDCVLKSPSYPFLRKLSIINQFNAFDLKLPPVQDFFEQILNMSFKQLLLEIGPENLLPEKLLPSLIHIKPHDTPESIALILAEVLIPGTQGLSSTNGGVTALTFVNNLPEASAKGAQLQVCLKAVNTLQGQELDWPLVFRKVKENLADACKRNSQPSFASVTQLFSALDFKVGPIDSFLQTGWWFDKTLLYMMQSMFTQQGAFNILKLASFEPCYADDVGDYGPLKWLGIARLQMKVMVQIDAQKLQPQSEADRKLDEWLVQFYESTICSELHHVIAGALALRERPLYVWSQIQRALALSMGEQMDSSAEIRLKLSMNLLAQADPDNTARKRDARSANGFGVLPQFLAHAKQVDYPFFLVIALEATSLGFDLKEVLDAELKNPRTRESVYVALFEALEARAARDFEAVQHIQQRQMSEPYRALEPLKVAVLYSVLNILKSLQGLVDAERFKNLQLQFLSTYPRLINYGTGHDAAIEANEAQYFNFFPAQVEQEMKAYYSKLYNKEMEIKDIVDMLAQMKESDVPHDQDVFACMIHSLIDEYRFFSEYPLSALASTSLLFGALLQRDLIQGTTLTVALNFIWESCNKPQDSNMFKFAVQSLYNFKLRLHEYPIYCKHLLKCQSLSAHAKMYQVVKDASEGIPCVEISGYGVPGGSGAEASSRQPEAKSIKYNAITVVKRTIGFVQQEEPNESLSDRLLFFVNNMTADKLSGKISETKDLLHEKYYSWFSNYLVAERAKLEPNNHALYASLVFELDAIFYEFVLETTILEIEHLLCCFKDTANERQSLKNLGAWLGNITLANDRPLKRDQVALKYLLVEAFDFNTLPVVIPLVSKILEQASHSKIFRPPSPWVLGILKVLAELYDCADLKLNLKFVIEVLLNAFDMKVKDITPSTIVRTHNPNPEALAAMFGFRPVSAMPDLGSLALENDQNFQMQQHLQQQALLQQQQNLQQQHPSARQDDYMSPAASTSQLDASFSNLKGTTVFVQNPNLRRAFQASLARAVRECAVPILNRVSEAVLTTTEALIRKDFATELDVAKFRKSYQILAQQLAHSMVICSGRKILSETVEATMLQLLGLQVNPSEFPLAELNLAIQGNVDLCVDIVENLAASNIGELIEERMRPQVATRERHPAGTPFMDPAVSEYVLQLPFPLGLPREGVRDAQLQIYSNFGSNTASISAEHLSPAAPGLLAAARQTQGLQPPHMRCTQVASAGGAPGAMQAQMARGNDSAEYAAHDRVRMGQLSDGVASAGLKADVVGIDHLFSVVTQLCEKAVLMLDDCQETSLAELGPDSLIVQALVQATAICQRNAANFPELLLKVAQYAVNCLFTQTHASPLCNEIFVVLLDKLCEYSPSTAKDVTWWMVYSVDQRKFNWPAIFALINVQLVAPLKLDGLIGKLIEESGSAVLVKFASILLLNINGATGTKPMALRSEFACTLQALARYAPASDTEETKQAVQLRDNLFDLLAKHNVPALPLSGEPATDMYVQMGYVFVEWTKLLGHSEPCTDLQHVFIDRLYHTEILTDPLLFEVFFRAATQIATAAFSAEHEIRSRTQRETYLTADCFAKLIVAVLLRFARDHASKAADYLRSIMGVATLVLVQEHDLLQHLWNERAYFRVFSSIFSFWSGASALDASATAPFDAMFFTTMADVLNSLQPLLYADFAFAWISLVSHRMFLPRLLELPAHRGYHSAVRLLTSLLKFQRTYAREKHDALAVLLKAVHRIFAALAHDYPDFLCACHYQLTTAISGDYTQLRNIVLSAMPKHAAAPSTDGAVDVADAPSEPVRAPVVSPYTKNLDYHALPNCDASVSVNYLPAEDLLKCALRKPVDNFLRIPAPALMRAIYCGIKLNYPKEMNQVGLDTVNFNFNLINALVLHVGLAVAEDTLPSHAHGFNNKSAHVTLLVDLLNYGNTEFRYHMVCAMADQLRYPSVLTQWFVSVALYMFTNDGAWNTGDVHREMQEIWLRVLLERVMVTKPHPWGLTVLFVALLRNKDVDLLSLPFVKSVDETFRQIFEALGRNVRA